MALTIPVGPVTRVLRTRPLAVVLLTALLCYLPFMNKAVHIDSDMMIHTARMLWHNPVDPPLGEYGRHMSLHDKTKMPPSSVYYRTGHPPLIPLLLAPLSPVAAERVWPYRIVMLGFYLAAVWAGWAFLGLFLPDRVRLPATILWATCPALLVNSHNIMWDVPVTALMLLALVSFIRGIRGESLRSFAVCGLLTGCAALTKSSAISLYPAFGLSLLLTRRWKGLAVWALPAVALPLFWVLHNLVVYGRILYLSVGWFSFLAGDIRYRFERIVTHFGGGLALPVFVLWVAVRQPGALRRYAPVALLCAVWAWLLFAVLDKPAWFAVSCGVFALAGIWLLVRAHVYPLEGSVACSEKGERMALVFYALFGVGVLGILPSASVRYALALYPLALLAMVDGVRKWGAAHQQRFWVLSLSCGIVLSIMLSVGDALVCEADRRLPVELVKKGYRAQNTWYYGRLAFAWYLHAHGFRNLRGDAKSRPVAGDAAIAEVIPSDYSLAAAVGGGVSLRGVDTLDFYRFAFRTKDRYAGFYGNSRLPYALRFGGPVRRYVVYAVDQAGPEELVHH